MLPIIFAHHNFCFYIIFDLFLENNKATLQVKWQSDSHMCLTAFQKQNLFPLTSYRIDFFNIAKGLCIRRASGVLPQNCGVCWICIDFHLSFLPFLILSEFKVHQRIQYILLPARINRISFICIPVDVGPSLWYRHRVQESSHVLGFVKMQWQRFYTPHCNAGHESCQPSDRRPA